ncbi:MAG: hypothetical protein DRP78_07175 [Candidatus Omnitrophota bacterium]|nr:MAG: hypothetical protein DRP78_07175 [Candidatus Omnitrophota bacterium]
MKGKAKKMKYKEEKVKINEKTITIHHYDFATQPAMDNWLKKRGLKRDNIFGVNFSDLEDGEIIYHFSIAGISSFEVFSYLDVDIEEEEEKK